MAVGSSDTGGEAGPDKSKTAQDPGAGQRQSWGPTVDSSSSYMPSSISSWGLSSARCYSLSPGALCTPQGSVQLKGQFRHATDSYTTQSPASF